MKCTRFPNYWIKYTSFELKISQKNKPEGKNFKNSEEIWSSRQMGEFDALELRGHLFVYACKIMQLSRFINENTKKNRQKNFPKWKIYSHKSLYRPKKQTRIIFAARRLICKAIWRNCKSNLKRSYWSEGTKFLKDFAKTVNGIRTVIPDL